MLNQGQVQRRGPQGTTGTARAPEALNPRTTKSTSLSPARREDGEADLRGAGASTRRGGRGTKRLSKDVVMPTRPHSHTALSQAVRGSRQGRGQRRLWRGNRSFSGRRPGPRAGTTRRCSPGRLAPPSRSLARSLAQNRLSTTIVA